VISFRGAVRFALVAAMLAAGFTPAAHATESGAIGWILTRTHTDAVPIDGTLSAMGVSDDSAVVMFATTGAGSQRRLDYRFGTTTAEWGVDGWVRVNDGVLPSVACPMACENPVGTQQTVYVSSNGRTLVSTVYVAAFDVKGPKLVITSPGWVVRPWHPTWQAVTTANAKGSTTVTAAHTTAGDYRGGELRGGSYGSFASALLPCDLSGTGSAIFTGGSRPWRMSCDYVTSMVDASQGRTTWRVTGDVTGASWATGVLIVVDYPR
jgi:hypothetical protein